MSDSEKTPAEHMADAQDGLYTIEESARGLRVRMIAEGWDAEHAEGVAARWLLLAINRAFEPPQVEKASTAKDTMTNVLSFLLLVAALPTIVILTVAGFRWALSL